MRVMKSKHESEIGETGAPEGRAFAGAMATVRTLAHGIELIVCEDHAAPVVSLQAWCRAGSIHEGDWLGGGLSHFLEHMLFKGTERRDGVDIAKSVQAAGGYINAYTSFDRTVYWIDAPSSGFESCLDVLCDTVANAALPEADFEKEQEVIRREFAMGDDQPESVLGKRLFSTAFAQHPCRHPVIGHLDLFNQLTRDDLAAYYHRQYTPDNIFLVVAGDVEADRVEELVAGHWENFRRRRRERSVEPEAEPRQMGRREHHEAFPTELSRFRMAWRIPGVTHPDLAPLDVLASLLGQGRSSRLYRRLREELGLTRSVGAYSWTPATDGLFIVSGDTDPEDGAAAQDAILECLDQLTKGNEGARAEEIAKASRMTLSSVFHSLTTASGIANDLATNWLLARNLEFTQHYVNAVSAVTVDQVQDVARRYLIDDSLSVVSLNPEDEKSAGSNGSDGSVRSIGKNGKGAPTVLSDTRRGDEVRREVLPNGLTLLVKEDQRTPLVTSHGVFRGGMLAETPTDNGITRLLARTLAKDTAARSAEQVAEQIESVGGSISAGGGNNSLGVTAGFMRPDFALGMDIFSDAMLAPRFLDEVVAREREFQIAGIKAEDDRPMSVAMRRLRAELFAAHPYGLRGSGTEPSVSSLNGEMLEDFRRRLICGRNAVIAVCGDVDTNQVIDRVAAMQEKMPDGEQLFAARGNGHSKAASSAGGEIVTEYHDKSQAVLLIGFPTGTLHDPDQTALDILDEACSDMASRLFIRIREEMGLAYSVGASRLVGLDPGCFLFYVATSPERLDDVQDALLGEIAELVKGGLTDEELLRARASLIGKQSVQLQSAGQLAGTIAVNELLGLGWDHHLKTADELQATGADQVKEVAQATFGQQAPTVVRLTVE